MTEHYTEANCRKLALERGGYLIKLSPVAGLAGIPDRLLLWPGGIVVFIEFKATGRYLKPRQKWWRDTLRRLGFRVHLFRATEEFRAMLDFLPQSHVKMSSTHPPEDTHADVATAPVPTPGDGTRSDPPRRRVRDLR